MNCDVCSDKKHLLNPGTQLWEACECLLRQQRNVRCQQANIPADYWDLTVGQLKGFTPETKIMTLRLLELSNLLHQGQFPSRHVILQGPAPKHKILGWLLLKAGLFKFGGLSIGLDDITTAFLTTDKRGFNRARDAQLLHISVGEDYTQKVHQFVLKHIQDHRSEERFCTIWSTQLTKYELIGRYGELPVFNEDTTIWVNVPPNTHI